MYLLSVLLLGASFYVDPINGNRNGVGTQERPWRTFAEVVVDKKINGEDVTKGIVHAGDTIYLLSGEHGSATINPFVGAYQNTSRITVRALPGHTPVMNQLSLRETKNWMFKGITFRLPVDQKVNQSYILANFVNVDDLIFDVNTLYSRPDVTGFSSEDWMDSAASRAIYYTGKQCTISGNKISNVRNGIYIGGKYITVTANSVDYFTDDALDFTSSDTVIRSNSITNHYGGLINGVHNDAMQGWTVNGETNQNIVIDRNMVVSSNGKYATIPPIATGVDDDYLQGISIFDGKWKNVTVTNNVVVAASYHIISMYGVSDLKIQNNTGVTTNKDGWIGVFNSKDGTVPTNVVLRNNICTVLNMSVVDAVSDHNILFRSRQFAGPETVIDPAKLFKVYSPKDGKYDFHLCVGSPAIGAGGDPVLTQDKDGIGRSSSNDCGAYIYRK